MADRVDYKGILAVVALLVALVELQVLPARLPSRDWQVPRDWPTKYGPIRGYALWGGTLGLGVLSYVPFASYHLFLVWLLLSRSAAVGLGMGLAYGLGRWIGSAIPAMAAARSPEQAMSKGSIALTNNQGHRTIQVGLLLVAAVWFSSVALAGA